MKRKFRATVKNGQLEYKNPDLLKEYLFNDISGSVDVTVDNPDNSMTPPQRRYYWGVIVKQIAEHLGMDNDEVHNMLKWKFLKIVAECGEEEYAFIKSTSELSTTEMNEYMRKCREWASMEFSIFIPKPNEYKL